MIQLIDHNIDPQRKGKEWILQAGKAISADFLSQGHIMFAKNNGYYDNIRLYGMGKQPISKYKKLKEVDEASSQSVMNVDWTPRGPGVKYRDLAIEKMLANSYTPIATPIDMQSKDENNALYADMKARLLMQKSLRQQQSDLADHPALQMEPDEPQDLDELEMRMEFGEQFNRARDIEQLVELCFHENRVPDVLRPMWMRDLWDFGVAAYREDLDQNGKPFCRQVDVKSFGCSSCRKGDFSDMQYAFEITEVPISELQSYFVPEEFEQIKNFDNYGLNPFAGIGMTYPHMRGSANRKRDSILVMDFEFYSWDTMHWDIGESSYGNAQIKRTAKKKNSKLSRTVKMVYCGKWVIGTEYLYSFGLKPNMKRKYGDLQRVSNTTLSFKAFAYNMHEMTTSSYMERLIPLIDDYMMVMLTAQNIRNNLVPNGYSFNLDALESVDLTQGGKNMTPQEIMSLFFKRGIILYRGSQLNSQNPNLKPIDISKNSISGEIASLYNELSAIVQQMRDVTGLNEMTDGSTPSDRMLNGVANMANTGTSTALAPLMRADKRLQSELANDLFVRCQQAVRKGGYSGFVPAINETTMKFVEADAAVANRDYAIMLEMRPSDEQKQWLLSNMQEEMRTGMLDISDAITIFNTYNMKQAQMILSFRVKKNREAKRQQDIENQQMTFKGQQESAMAAEGAKQETLKLEYSLKMELEKLIAQKELAVARMRAEAMAGARHEKAESAKEEEAEAPYMEAEDPMQPDMEVANEGQMV